MATIQIFNALSIMKQYLGLEDEDKAWDDTFTLLLEKSKSNENYRPWACLALQFITLSAGGDRGMIRTADGVTWMVPNDLDKAINGLLMTQLGMDAGDTGLLPPWDVESMKNQFKGTSKVLPVIGFTV